MARDLVVIKNRTSKAQPRKATKTVKKANGRARVDPLKSLRECLREANSDAKEWKRAYEKELGYREELGAQHRIVSKEAQRLGEELVKLRQFRDRIKFKEMCVNKFEEGAFKQLGKNYGLMLHIDWQHKFSIYHKGCEETLDMLEEIRKDKDAAKEPV